MTTEFANNIALQAPQEVQTLTWKDLLKSFFECLKNNNKRGQKRNFNCAFKLFMTLAGLTMESPVGAELAEEFEAKVAIFVTLQIRKGLAASTYKPRVSKLRALKEFVAETFAPKLLQQSLPKAFGKRLRHLIKNLGCNVKDFWRRLPEGLIRYDTICNWCVERYLPSVNLRHVIKTIETHLKVPAGTLSLPRYLSAGQNLEIGVSDNGNKTRAARLKPYRVWNRTLKGEFKKLYSYKTEAILPEGVERSIAGYWTRGEGEDVASSDVAEGILKSFMGFCALPADNTDPYLKGAGIRHKELSISLLAVKELVEGHVNFMKLRSGLRVRSDETDHSGTSANEKEHANGHPVFYDVGGKYNNGTILFLSLVSSLLHPVTGYLTQHPEFAKKLRPRMTAATWQQQCSDTRTRVNKLLGQILLFKKNKDREKFDFGRDPKETIKWLLEQPRPLLILHQVIKGMLDDLLPESAPLMTRARQFRDILLIAMLTSNPLRIRMFSIMEFGKHLTRDEDGTWWLEFKQGAFKNRRALKSDYKVRVARELWPLLDRYKDEFHPVLIGSARSAFVFVGAKRGGQRKPRGFRLSENSLSDIVRDMTELYMPGKIGFRPHAFRHLVATDIIKRDPKVGFFLASIALHDKLETVEETYVHLKSSEFFEPVNIHFSETWDRVFGRSEVVQM
jgi:integrase